MPQLKIETFVTQYFWLIVILLSFYFIMYTVIIPRMTALELTRQRLESTKRIDLNSNISIDHSLDLKITGFNVQNSNPQFSLDNTILEWAKKKA